MKFTLVLVIALAAFAKAESDNTMEIAINFIKDCKDDYISCVKVNKFLSYLKSESDSVRTERVIVQPVESSFMRLRRRGLISYNFHLTTFSSDLHSTP